jgi:hypothetical protein
MVNASCFTYRRLSLLVDRGDMSAKFWLDPIALADNHGYSRKELRNIERIMTENLEILKNEWDAFCSGHIRPAQGD